MMAWLLYLNEIKEKCLLFRRKYNVIHWQKRHNTDKQTIIAQKEFPDENYNLHYFFHYFNFFCYLYITYYLMATILDQQDTTTDKSGDIGPNKIIMKPTCKIIVPHILITDRQFHHPKPYLLRMMECFIMLVPPLLVLLLLHAPPQQLPQNILNRTTMELSTFFILGSCRVSII